MKGNHKGNHDSPDTYIPHGYLLVPIDIENKDFIKSLSHGFALVDLYIASKNENSSSRRNQLVAQAIKLIQAPLNPNQFGVLVKESEANELINYHGPFLVVLHNPTENKDLPPQIAKSEPIEKKSNEERTLNNKQSFQIEYYEESPENEDPSSIHSIESASKKAQ